MGNDRKRIFLANLHALSRTYHLDKARVLDTIDETLSRVLAARYRDGQVMVRLNERTLDCDIVQYGRDGHIREISPSMLTGVGNLQKHVMRALTEQAAIETATNLYQQYKRNTCLGAVRAVSSTGSWWVDLFVADDTTLVAECPLTHQTPRDREDVRIGSILAFRVSKVRVIDQSRVQVLADRRSRAIVEFLMREELKKHRQEMRVTCRVRRVGQYCEVLTEKKVPKHIRDSVAKMLGEPLTIFYGDRAQVRASQQRKRQEKTTLLLRVANQKEW